MLRSLVFMSKTSGRLFVISGPSGVGKGTVILRLLERIPDLSLSVSATTRLPRGSEVSGDHYYFLSHDQFDRMVENNEFSEWCWVHSHRYGTPRSEIEPRINNGHHVLVEIDVQGAEKLRREYPDLVSIFISPPSEDVLLDRLSNRRTESREMIDCRLEQARHELSQKHLYTYVVVNDQLDDCVQEVAGLITNFIKQGESQ